MNVLTDASYGEYLRGKRVAVVGRSPSLLGSCQGELIDGYDAIVRINLLLPYGLPTDSYIINEVVACDIGSRTDIVYTHPFRSLDCDTWLAEMQRYIEAGVKYLLHSFPKEEYSTQNLPIDAFLECTPDGLPVRPIPFKMYRWLYRMIGAQPTSGFSAFVDVLRFPVKEIGLFGFTCFQLPKELGDKEYLNAPPSRHNADLEWEMWKAFIKVDRRVHVEKVLGALIGGDYRRILGASE